MHPAQEPVEIIQVPEEAGRYRQGWRRGKPMEDPDKLKRWGFVTAKPSEYLIYLRDGKIDRKRSGQGARVFKWPWQSVAIVPTTLQKVEFAADQITKERVGVRVTGIAVYRVAEPELAYRVLNFTYGESANEKLGATLREMFVGAARRLIANLTLDACLTKRKEAIATFLMEEIAPVVSGRGAASDTTDQGWGVVIDTIEIQDVQVQSRQVFEHLQAPFRAEIAARAEAAELERQRALAERRADTERKSMEATIVGQRETRILKARAEAEAAESESAESLRAEQAKVQVQEADLLRKEQVQKRRIEWEHSVALQQAAAQATLDRRKSELAQEHQLKEITASEQIRRAKAEAEVAALKVEASRLAQEHQLEASKLAQQHERKRLAQATENELREAQVALELELRKRQAEVRKLEQDGELSQQRALAEMEQFLCQGRALRELVTQGLPQIAQAFKQSFGTIHYTHVGGGEEGGPHQMVASTIAQVLAVAKDFGLDLSKLGQTPK